MSSAMLRWPRAGRAGRALAFVAASGALAAALVACAAKDTVVGDVAVAPEGGPCATNDDCPSDSFCAKATCGAATGACARRPIVCPKDDAVVCGCDLVSYWNDCLRRQNGVAASAPDQCITEVAPCGGADHATCAASGAVCAQFVGDPTRCDSAAPGACWVLPPSCPDFNEPGAPPPPPPEWAACSDPQRCLETCAAIRSGLVFRLPPHPMCR